VGEYTARAVLVFAFDKDVGVVDTNVLHVLARAVAGRPLSRSAAQVLADRLVPAGASWAYNQAMFDVGACHCTARGPDCHRCPLRRRCRWALAGRTQPDPARASPAAGRPQSTFEGSDRQGRGRLVEAMRSGPVAARDLSRVAGWPDDLERASRAADALVAEGLGSWTADGSLGLA
jgi:A/G-specific adenine glycosylase